MPDGLEGLTPYFQIFGDQFSCLKHLYGDPNSIHIQCDWDLELA